MGVKSAFLRRQAWMSLSTQPVGRKEGNRDQVTWCPEGWATVPGAQGMEKAIAKGSGGGQNSNHRTGVPGPPACTGKGLLGCGPRGQQGSSTERKRGNEDRMTPVPSQGTPVEGASVLNGGGARASQVGCWVPEWE